MGRSTSNLNTQLNSDEDADVININKRSFLPFEWLFNNRFYNVYPFFNRLYTVDPDEQALKNEVDDTNGFSSKNDATDEGNNNEEALVDGKSADVVGDDIPDNAEDLTNDDVDGQDSTDERRVYDLRPRLTTINYKE